MKNYKYKNFIFFWISQSVSELGSSMTAYALIIWAYTKTNSVVAVSFITFFSYLPYILGSIFVGQFVDKHNKKNIMLICDLGAALCSIVVLVLVVNEKLEIYQIYIVNLILGFMNSFQSPAEDIAVGIIVDNDFYSRASGMNSFSNSLNTVFTPVITSFVMSFIGLKGVIVIDLITFTFAFIFLLFFIKIPEEISSKCTEGVFKGVDHGVMFLKNHKLILYIIISIAVLNLISTLTYENILTPMILARSSNNYSILGIVNGVLGLGGILGGFFVSIKKLNIDSKKMTYYCAAISFLLGDFFMSVGRTCPLWCFAALAASIPMPFIGAGQNVILYTTVPTELQGRVFTVRNALQYCTIPIGTLLSGYLADYIFEPMMKTQNDICKILQIIVGSGHGSGMAVMFLCTSILGFMVSIVSYNIVKKL